MLTDLHFYELLIVVFTEVVHQLHGPGLATGGAWTFGWFLHSATHHVAQHFLPAGGALEYCRPACMSW